MLTRLIYVSRAFSPLPLDLKDILLTARKSNAVLGITGVMCFLDGIYFQCIEGEACAVSTLYQKIERDPRHQGMKLLIREPIALRDYPEWSMALLTWNEDTKAIFRLFNPDIALDVYATDPTRALLMLRAWSRTSNWMTLPAPAEGNA